VAEWARSRGAATLVGEFVPTAKNAPAADFFSRHEFTPVTGDSGATVWTLDLQRTAVAWPPHLATQD
jgi:hypothetical protein